MDSQRQVNCRVGGWWMWGVLAGPGGLLGLWEGIGGFVERDFPVSRGVSMGSWEEPEQNRGVA